MSGQTGTHGSRKAKIGVFGLALMIVLAVVGPAIAPYSPDATSSAILQGPSSAHLLGTTSTGQDVLSQLLVGAWPSLFVGFLAASIATILSVIFGILSGYLGGAVGETSRSHRTFSWSCRRCPSSSFSLAICQTAASPCSPLSSVSRDGRGARGSFAPKPCHSRTVTTSPLRADRREAMADYMVRADAGAPACNRINVLVYGRVRDRYASRARLSRVGTSVSVDVGDDAVLGTEPRSVPLRSLVVVRAARPRDRPGWPPAGVRQLRHR